MSKVPKKDIDRIFKDGSDRYDFPFNAEAWNKMEGMLDREKRRRALIWWTVGILGVLLLILLFFWIKPSNPSTPTELPEVSRQAIAGHDQATGQPDAGAAIPPDANPAGPAVEGSKNGEISRLDVGAVDQHPDHLQTRKETATRAGGTPPSSGSPIILEPTIAPTVHEPLAPVTTATDQPETTGAQEIRSTQEKTGSEEKAPPRPPRAWQPLSLLTSLEINPIFSPASRILPDLPENRSLVEAPSKPVPNQFLVGVAFAPEFNSVGYRDLSTVSWKWGLRLEYQYAGKFGFTAGAHLVNKKYQARPGSYTPPKGFWTRKIAPVETDGECTVLEIPVGLTFYPKGYDQSGFFSEVGMSSFLMLEEHYYYHYDVPDNDLVRYWGGENENQHWLGILNISIGYNLLVSDHLSARVAPYTQIPLSGVGHGQVKLSNLGAQLSFHYGFPGD